MDATACPGCLAHLARIAELERTIAELERTIAVQERRIADLEARLNVNSTNSSVPPSANPLGAPKPVIKKKSKRRRGAQKGHSPHLKRLFPPERVHEVIVFRPTTCEHCHAELPTTPTATDPEPTRFQSVEIPPIVSIVTEYQGHACTCPACGEVTRASIPPDIRAASVGPRLTATLSYFTGCHGMSKRAVEEVSEAVFAAPVALGTVVNLEQEVSAALEAPHAEALQVVREAAVKHADETSWKLAGKLCWLWAAATMGVVAFVIHAKRSALGLTALLGAEIQGILCSDRWGPYNRVDENRRQLCWAHLKRDFQKLVDRGGNGAQVGRAGLRMAKAVFAAWHAFQDQGATREQLRQQLAPVIQQMNRVLLQGWNCGDPTAEAFCYNLLEVEQALWTFTREEGVEPTNNHIERLLRRAVLWRRRSFGSQSAAGCRFVERILTVVQTRRLQDKSVLEYLHDALVASRSGLPCPKLIPQG
jgi:transposase